MSPQMQQFIATRAAGLMFNARRKPECATSARNWLNLAARCAERSGETQLASDIRRFEQAILEV